MGFTELTAKALTEYFEDFKEYHTIIMIVFVGILAISQSVYTIWINRKIERFKAVLNKSEIKFSRYHNLQVDALKTIYNKLVDFHFSNARLFNSKYESNNHSQYIKRIEEWHKNYYELFFIVNREKILLPDTLKKLFKRTIKDFEVVKNILTDEKDNIDDLLESCAGDWQELYGARHIELGVINSKISSMKSQQEFIISENNIKELREKVENYFSEMNK